MSGSLLFWLLSQTLVRRVAVLWAGFASMLGTPFPDPSCLHITLQVLRPPADIEWGWGLDPARSPVLGESQREARHSPAAPYAPTGQGEPSGQGSEM